MTRLFEYKLWNPMDEDIIPKFIDVFKAAFGNPQISSKETFLWKHREKPLGPSYIPYAVDAESGRIASVRPFGSTELMLNGTIFPSFEPLDTATHPDFVRMGLFTRLTQQCIVEGERRKCLFFYNNPNFNSRPGYLKLGSKDVGGIQLLIKPLRIIKTGLTFTFKRKSMIGFSPKSYAVENYVNIKQALPEDIESMLKIRAKWQDVWAGHRTREMLEYRFIKHPFHHYEVVEFEEGVAFVLLGQRGPLMEGKIVEVFFRVDGSMIKKAITSLIRCIRNKFDLDFLSVVFTVGHPYFEAFKNSGFYKAPSRISFYRYTFSHCPSELTDKPWALTGADIDTQ